MNCRLIGLLPSALLTAFLFSGCVAPRSQVNALKAQSTSLAERNEALTEQIENLKVHTRNTEDNLIRAEEDLALLEEELGLDRSRLANLAGEREELHAEVRGLMGSRPPAGSATAGRLAQVSQRYGSLKFQPGAGVSKLDTDLLFDTASDALKPGAEAVLQRLASVLNSAEGQSLKVLLVGHTDDQLLADRTARERFGDNFGLSIARAHQVSQTLRRMGVEESRLGIAGYGSHQPVAANRTAEERSKNRRVEIFVMAEGLPVIGWTESTPNLY